MLSHPPPGAAQVKYSNHLIVGQETVHNVLFLTTKGALVRVLAMLVGIRGRYLVKPSSFGGPLDRWAI